MIAPQFIHKFTNSFMLWADNTLLQRGGAFTVTGGALTHYSDTQLPDHLRAWGSPFKEWVTDSSVSGAVVPSGFYINGSFQTPSGDYFNMDFQNGRVLTSGLSSSQSITGSYSVKDFNIYLTNQDEEALIVEVCQNSNNQYNTIGTDISTPYLPPYAQKIPAIFVNVQSQKNEPLALGGTDSSVIRANMVVFAKDPYQLDGVLGLFADTSDEVFKELPLEASPLNEWGGLKNNRYSYTETVAASGTNNIFIDEVTTSKMTDSLRRGLKTELYVGFVDFSCAQYRNPRVSV
jgi:hypothetical protein